MSEQTKNLPAAAGDPGLPMTPAERRAMIRARARQMRDEGKAPTRPAQGVAFISLNGNTGAFTFGRDNTPVPDGQEFVVVANYITRNQTFWVEGRPMPGKKMSVPIFEGDAPVPPAGEPKKGDLPKPRERDGWTPSTTLQMIGIGSGDLRDVKCAFESSSTGGMRAMDGIIAEINERAAEAGEGDYLDPVVVFRVDSYEHKTYKREVFTLEYEIVGWVDSEVSLKDRQPADSGSGEILQDIIPSLLD